MGWRVEKKCLCIVFWLTRRSWVCGKKSVLGHPIAQATSYCLSPDTFWLQASKNVFKVGSVKFKNSLSLPSTVKKVRTRSKGSQLPRDLSDAWQKSRELTTPSEPPNIFHYLTLETWERLNQWVTMSLQIQCTCCKAGKCFPGSVWDSTCEAGTMNWSDCDTPKFTWDKSFSIPSFLYPGQFYQVTGRKKNVSATINYYLTLCQTEHYQNL